MLLKQTDNLETFSNDVDSFKDNLRSMVLIGVTRTNQITGGSSFLGYTRMGKFTDSVGVDNNAAPPVIGTLYKYVFKAYLLDPNQFSLDQDVKKSKGSQVILNISDLYIPQNISKVQDKFKSKNVQNARGTIQGNTEAATRITKQFVNEKIYKSLSPKALSSGVVRSNDISDANYNPDRFSTGDFAEKDISIVPNFNLSSGGSSVTRSSTGLPVIRVRLLGQSALKMIDYFIFTEHKQSRNTICGVAHNDQSGDISFIDYTSKDFVGQIEYFATPVLLDGRHLDRINITKFVLNPMFPPAKVMGK